MKPQINQSKPKKLLFESKVCTRCGGDGRYSFNLIHGSICYGCGGCGQKLTKRGVAAQRYFRELSTVKAADLKPGDVIRAEGLTRGFDAYTYAATVESVSFNCQEVTITLRSKLGSSTLITSLDDGLQMLSGDRKARIAASLAYQATLTKAGLPKKRRVRGSAPSKVAVEGITIEKEEAK